MKKTRNAGYDLIRLIAMLAVVCIHGFVAFISSGTKQVEFVLAIEICTLCLVGAPLFFMISGALLLDTEEPISVRTLFTRRLPKQLIPFVIWSLIYVFARIFAGKVAFGVAPFVSLIYEPAYAQFWFMYVLLGIYLLLPVLTQTVTRLDKSKLEYLLAIWLIFSVLLKFTESLSGGVVRISTHLDFLKLFGYLGYFILGYYLKKFHSEIKARTSILVCAGSLAVGMLFAFFEWFIAYKTNSAFDGVAYRSYFLPTLPFTAAGLFTLFGNMKLKLSTKHLRLIECLSDCTVGVYYIHMLVMVLIERLGLLENGNIFISLLKVIVTYLISYLLSFVILKIPYLNLLLLGKKQKRNFHCTESAREEDQ